MSGFQVDLCFEDQGHKYSRPIGAPMHFRPSRLSALTWALAFMINAGCHDRSGATVIPAESAAAVSIEGTCRLLSTEEVSAALSGSKAGRADNSRREYGITTCEWETGRG